MKTSLISVLTATLLGFVSQANGHSLNASELIAVLFATGLAAWTIKQYSFEPRALTTTRPIRLAIKQLSARPAAIQTLRLAA